LCRKAKGALPEVAPESKLLVFYAFFKLFLPNTTSGNTHPAFRPNLGPHTPRSSAQLRATHTPLFGPLFGPTCFQFFAFLLERQMKIKISARPGFGFIAASDTNKIYQYFLILAPSTTSSLRKNDHLLRDHEQTSFATRRSKKRIE
jgi:hypothetical protein